MESLFFVAAKISWLLVQPDVWILVLCVLATVFCYRGKYLQTRKMLVVLSALIIAISVFPVGEWLMHPLESRFQAPNTLPQQVDGIITLGGGEYPFLSRQWQQVELGEAVERYTAFMQLIKRYPSARAVVSSGSGSLTDQSAKGADVIKLFLQQQGVNTEGIIFERQSRNTYENLFFSREKVQPKANENWLIITSAYHMPRVIGVAQKLGWKLIPYPVDHYSAKQNLLRTNFNFSANLSLLNAALHEYLGLLGYAVFGKSASLFPD